MSVFSQSQKTVAISTTAANATLDQSGFEALTYTTVSKVGSIGETGNNTNTLTYDTMDDDVVQKGKGMTNAGDPQLECARIAADAGQVALRAAAAIDNFNNYAFKVVMQDGTVQYLRGLVMGPTRPGGRNEDFELEVFTLALNQPELIVDPAT